MDKSKPVINYYVVHYLPEIEETIIELLQKIEPLTLEIVATTITKEYSDTFEKFLDMNYYYIIRLDLYCSKQYFHNANFIREKNFYVSRHEDPPNLNLTVTYTFNKFNTVNLNYHPEKIDVAEIKYYTPIILLADNVLTNIDGCEILKI